MRSQTFVLDTVRAMLEHATHEEPDVRPRHRPGDGERAI
jgi:hypothetical protein